VSCPLCERDDGEVWLRRTSVPVHQNRIAPSREAARACPRGDLELARCRGCGFVWNAAFDPARIVYDAEYDNNQTHSPVFREYTDALARELVGRLALRGKTALEVGCGKGDFLVGLVAAGAGRGLGFDTSYVGPESREEGRVRFARSRYARGATAEVPDAVVSRHVIEHVPQPLRFLRDIREALEGAPRAAVFLETPTVEWILARGVFWDLFYEHCSYFDTRTLPWACARAGLTPRSAEPAFGEQYQHVVASPGEPVTDAAAARANAATIERLVARYLERAGRTEAAVRELMARHRPGDVAVWGAGAKGATLLHVLDPDATRLRYVVDISPGKQGRFTPGTGHAIVGPDALAEDPPAAVLLMNQNYRVENEAHLRRLGVSTTLVTLDLLEPDRRLDSPPAK